MNINIRKILRKAAVIPDYMVFAIAIPIVLTGLLLVLPWILNQRKIWESEARGNRKVLVLRRFTLEKIKNFGYAPLLPFRNPSLKWVGILDPVNTEQTETEITDDLHLITWKLPEIIGLMGKKGFAANSMLLRELIATYKTLRYCVKEKIGAIRIYKYDYPALQALLISTLINIPFIVDVMANFELIRRLTGKVYYFRRLNKHAITRIIARPAANWLLGLPLRRANRILGRNKNNYEHAFALGAPVDRLSLIRVSNFNARYNSYDPELPPAKPADYPYILFVGRLVDIKYPQDAIEAFELAAPHMPDYRLVIIGDGVLREVIKQKKEQSEYENRIILMGACPSEIVFEWTAHAKMAICPYSGSALVEAMLCSIPVVAYDVEWHAEIVIDDYTGYLVPFANVEALAQKLVYVHRHDEEAKIVGQRSREMARVAFDKDKIVEKESLIYKQVLQIPVFH
jgi:glycosyltransferase involved in cell wall biosynthesis